MSIRCDQLAAQQLIASETVAAHVETNPAAEQKSRATHSDASPVRDGGAGSLQRGIEINVADAPAYGDDTAGRIKLSLVDERHIDHQAVRRRKSGIGVTAGPCDERDIVLLRPQNRLRHVGRARAFGDTLRQNRGVTQIVGHRGRPEAVIAWPQHRAGDATGQLSPS